MAQAATPLPDPECFNTKVTRRRSSGIRQSRGPTSRSRISAQVDKWRELTAPEMMLQSPLRLAIRPRQSEQPDRERHRLISVKSWGSFSVRNRKPALDLLGHVRAWRSHPGLEVGYRKVGDPGVTS
jgi:hypothetical protein